MARKLDIRPASLTPYQRSLMLALRHQDGELALARTVRWLDRLAAVAIVAAVAGIAYIAFS